jgi:hypothetical protein
MKSRKVAVSVGAMTLLLVMGLVPSTLAKDAQAAQLIVIDPSRVTFQAGDLPVGFHRSMNAYYQVSTVPAYVSLRSTYERRFSASAMATAGAKVTCETASPGHSNSASYASHPGITRTPAGPNLVTYRLDFTERSCIVAIWLTTPVASITDHTPRVPASLVARFGRTIDERIRMAKPTLLLSTFTS